jgi:acetyl esterase/lipase
MSIQLTITKQMMKKRGNSFGKHLSVDALRESVKASEVMKPVKGVEFIPTTLGGIDAEIVRPKKTRKEAVVLYIHGGGFMVGSYKYYRAFTSYFAKMSELEMYCADYRLAPEHKFPAGPDDCFAAYQALVELVPGKKIFLLGESAGATLILVTALKAKTKGIKLPAGIIAYAPLTDATDAVDRSPYTKTDLVIGEGAIEWLRELYCPDEDYTNPYISPYYDNYEGFPPLRLVWDRGEQNCPDNARFSEKVKGAGVYVEAKQWEDTFHTFEILAGILPEAKTEIHDSIAFINKFLNER